MRVIEESRICAWCGAELAPQAEEIAAFQGLEFHPACWSEAIGHEGDDEQGEESADE